MNPITRTEAMTALSDGDFISVDTIVNLYGVHGSDRSRVAIVGGYNWIGDGGGGVFFWDPSTTAGENYGTTIVPTNSPRGRWLRSYSGPLDVRYFGAKGQGNRAQTDQVNINLAIAAAAAQGGGEVYVPPGAYMTTGPIVINVPSVRLIGAGPASRIVPLGSFNTIEINNTRFVEVGKLFLDDSSKPAGKAIEAIGVGNLTLADVIVLGPCDGIHLHNFNHVNVDRVSVVKPRGRDGYGFWLSGGGKSDTGRSDAISFKDVVVEGLGFTNARPGEFITDGRRHGLIIDGSVNTVSVNKLYILAMQGVGVWFRNVAEASSNPEFASFYGLEVDFPQLEGIRIDVGQRLYLTDTMIHQSHERTNVAVGTDVATGVNTVSFKGGFSSGAWLSGIDIWGKDVCVQGMNILANSRSRPAESDGSAGVEVRGSARQISISSNTVGDPDKNQAYGIRIASGASDYAIIGNLATGNKSGGIRNTPGSTAGLREVVGNTGAVV
ncbi:MAG TPA: glycosyl hydrolase family 28-related protein [Bryobacteraceae bacterium]|nr:glycosyl hydrolase family 28-related protein [Bryobacteraceae bacterium]